VHILSTQFCDESLTAK